MKKLMKRIGAVLMAVAMMAALGVSAWAVDDPPTNNQTRDPEISVTGVTAGDNVAFYQVLKFDQNAEATGGWVNATGFNLTDDQIKTIVGKTTPSGIDSAMAGTIATMITANDPAPTAKATETATAEGAKYTISSDADAGLYVVIVKSSNPEIVYNPVFVAADFKNTAPDHTWAIDLADSYADNAMAKKAEVTVTKTANDPSSVDTATDANDEYDPNSETVSVGDVVTFTVTTSIPEFADNYTNAAFEVQDTLTAGLQLLNEDETGDATAEDNSIVVKVGGNELAPTTTTAGEGGSSVTTTNYTVTASKSGYKVEFSKAYLLGLTDDQSLEITYKAKVTNEAQYSVNQDANTVVVRFSNDPRDNTSRAKLIDKTNHYTFDIDADLLGETPGSWPTTEVVKVGLDKDGNEITTTNTTLHEGQTSVGALQGAEFALYVPAEAGDDGAVTIKNEAGTDITVKPYVNDILTAGKKIVSDATGRLTIQGETKAGIRGLDAGTYYLVETQAPSGYIKAQNGVKIEIIPTFQEKTETIVDGSDSLTVKVKELTSYQVKMNGNETAKYTMTNAADGAAKSASKGDTVTGDDDAGYIVAKPAEGGSVSSDEAAYGKITNIQGTELPSTGGIGTYVFTVAGVAIMAIAAGLLIVRHKKKAE